MIFNAPLFVLICLSSVISQNLDRVLGGSNAKEGQFPYQVSIKVHGSHVCGGSIVSDYFVLTAAHCVENVNLRNIYNSRGGEIRGIVKIIIHERYKRFRFDVALIEIDYPFEFNEDVDSIPLATEEVSRGDEVVISGWGLQSEQGSIPEILQWNILTALSKTQCRWKFGKNSKAILCLGHSSGKSACYGDSGGPATFKGKLVGVSNFGVESCNSDSPNGYAKVSYYHDWIVKHISEYRN